MTKEMYAYIRCHISYLVGLFLKDTPSFRDKN